jgi:hypothetical protein
MASEDVDDGHCYQSREDVCRYLPFAPRTREEVAERIALYASAPRLGRRAPLLAQTGAAIHLVLVVGLLPERFCPPRALTRSGAANSCTTSRVLDCADWWICTVRSAGRRQ